MTEKQLLTIQEFMNEYSMSRTATFKAIKKGALKAKKMSGDARKVYIKREDAEIWANSLEDSQ